jgi:hypothetical protein
MSESHECTVHHNCIDLVVQITRSDEDADWELGEVRIPSMMPNKPDSEDISGWLDRTFSGSSVSVFDELLTLALADLAATDKMHQCDEAEDREAMEALA